MFTLRAQKVLIERVYMKFLQLQGTQEKRQVQLKQLTVYIYCNNEKKSREKKVILTNLVIIKTTRIQDKWLDCSKKINVLLKPRLWTK